MKEKLIIGIIPARMGSTRFPGKALAKIWGVPMIGHIYHRSKMSRALHDVFITTPDDEIAEYADSIGAKWVKDKEASYRGCSNATADATLEIERKYGHRADVVVMIQGDEPMIVPEMIDLAVQPFLDEENPPFGVINLMAPIRSVEEHNDPNCPKVVVDKYGHAVYFSREPIPSRKKWKGDSIPMYKQVCIMPFTREFLLEFIKMPPTPLEEIESIDMNRVIEHGHKVKMVYEDFETYSVDTPEDLRKVEKYMSEDPLVKTYARDKHNNQNS